VALRKWRTLTTRTRRVHRRPLALLSAARVASERSGRKMPNLHLHEWAATTARARRALRLEKQAHHRLPLALLPAARVAFERSGRKMPKMMWRKV